MGVWGITQGKRHYSHSAAAELDLCLAVKHLKKTVCSSPTAGPGAGTAAVELFCCFLELIRNEEHYVVTANINERLKKKKIYCQLSGGDHHFF